jgi:hypothetical protein
MGSERSKEIEVEVLPPEPRGQLATRGRSLPALLRDTLWIAPPIRRPAPPKLSREDLEASFAHRLGAAVLFSARSIECALSPDGTLRAFAYLFTRWFIALLTIALVATVPALVAAQFVESIMIALESAMRHLFQACLYLLQGVVVLAAIGAGFVFLLGRRSK